MITRRALLAGAAVLAASPASAEGYPTHQILLIAPYPPGGTTDLVARAISGPLSQALGQTVFVDNRAGAGGLIGHELAAKAEPDGYTLVLGNSAMLAVSVSLYPNLPYDPIKDFTPISLIAKGGLVLLVNPKLPVSTLAELLALAKSKPGKLNAGISALGAIHHLMTEILKKTTHLDWADVAYKGSGPMLLDLIGGQLDFGFDNIPSAVEYVKAGRLRALAVTSTTRSPLMPDVPTLRECGVPLDGVSWHGLLGPAGVPAEIVDRLSREVVKIVRDPKVCGRFEALGLDPVGSTPAEFATFIKDENVRWAAIAKESGAKLE